jgi:hypothetical protein
MSDALTPAFAGAAPSTRCSGAENVAQSNDRSISAIVASDISLGTSGCVIKYLFINYLAKFFFPGK